MLYHLFVILHLETSIKFSVCYEVKVHVLEKAATIMAVLVAMEVALSVDMAMKADFEETMTIGGGGFRQHSRLCI